MDTTYMEKLERINEIKKQKGIYNQIFLLFEIIFAEREAFKKRKQYPAFSVDRERVELNLSKGVPYIENDFFKLVKTPAEEFFINLFGKISKNLGENAELIENSLIKKGDGFQKLLMGNFESDSADIGFDANLATFLMRQCRRPFLEVFRNKYTAHYDDSKWNRSTCPLCGSMPFLEELRGENGKRYMFCPDCGMEWAFKRITCPFCYCTDHEKLGYFSSEAEPYYIVSFCNACNYYMKRVDFRENEKIIIPEIEHIATLHLDIVAKNQGFKTRDGFVNFIAG